MRMSGRWTRRWASCARGRNRARAKRRRRDRRMRARRGRCGGCAGASGKPPQRRWPVVRRREEGRRGERRQAFLAGGLYLIMIAPKGGEFSRPGQKNENRCARASGREPFFCARKGRARGEGAGEAGGGVVVRICTNRENARMAAKRGDGEWMRTGGEPGERMGGEGVRKRRERRKAERGGGCAAARGGRN